MAFQEQAIAYIDESIAYMLSFESLASKTLFDIPVLTPMLEGAASGIAEAAGGMDLLTIKYIVCMLAAYPLSLMQHLIPATQAKMVVQAVVGIHLAQFVFGTAWLTAGLSSLVAYAFLWATQSKGWSSWRPALVMVWMMAFMSVSHIYRMYTDWMGWSVDFTGPQMIVTMKVTQIAYNLWDGDVEERSRLQADVAAAAKARGAQRAKLERKARLANFRLSVALEEMPSVVEYLCFIYNSTTFFAGPVVELKKWRGAMSGKAFPGGTIPLGTAIAAGVRKFFVSLVCITLWLVGNALLPLSYELSEEKLGQRSLVEILVRTPVILLSLVVGHHTKYYFAWKLSEGAANWAGIGYDESGKDAWSSWSAADTADIVGVYTATSLTAITRAWNKRAQHWLEEYIFKRVTRTARLNLWATYFVSAFWHGFYPAYYLAFFSVPLVSELQRRLGAAINPWFYTDKKATTPREDRKDWAYLLEYTSWLITITFGNYVAIAFVMLSWERAIAVWSSFNFSVHNICVVGHVVVTFMWWAGIAGDGTSAKVKSS